MAQPTLDDLYRQHGTQPAEYLDDYLKEKGARLVKCGRCGRLLVMRGRPAERLDARQRCAECIAATGKVQ